MYKVYCDGYTLHDPSINDKTYQLLSPEVTQEANKAGNFTFTIPAVHANANAIHRLMSTIEVYDDSKLIFRGRPLNDSEDWDKSRTIVCESDLAKLNDSILRPYTFTGTVEAYLQQLVTWHNAQVPAAKQFTVGTVTVVSNENTQHTITRENSTYPKTWNELEDKLLSKFEGYLFITWTGTTNRIDYLADSPYHCTQAITFRHNLLDFGRERKGEDIITRLIPLGAKDEQTGLRLTVKSVNDDKDYITDTTAAESYGIINDKAVFDEVTSAAELLLRGQEYLAENTSGTTSVTLTAADLHLMDSSISSFDFLSYVTVNDPAHDISGEMLVTKKTTNLVDPSQGKMTIGKQSTGISQYYAGTAAEVSQIPEIYATKSEVTTIQTTIQSELIQQDTKIGMVVAESSGSYVIRSAQIVAAINQENGSTVYIDADHIRVTGQMVVSAINGGSTTIDGSKITTGSMNASAIGAGTIDASVIAVTNLNASNITTGRLLVKDSNNYVLFDADILTKTVSIAGFAVKNNSLEYNNITQSVVGYDDIERVHLGTDKVQIFTRDYETSDGTTYAWATSATMSYDENPLEGACFITEYDNSNDPTTSYRFYNKGLFDSNELTLQKYNKRNNGTLQQEAQLVTGDNFWLNLRYGSGGYGRYEPQAWSINSSNASKSVDADLDGVYVYNDSVETALRKDGVRFHDPDHSDQDATFSVMQRLHVGASTETMSIPSGIYLALVTHNNNSTANEQGLYIIQCRSSGKSVIRTIAAASNSTLSISAGSLTWDTTNSYRTLTLIRISG